jgi:hypothetical protein
MIPNIQELGYCNKDKQYKIYWMVIPNDRRSFNNIFDMVTHYKNKYK